MGAEIEMSFTFSREVIWYKTLNKYVKRPRNKKGVNAKNYF